MTRTSFLKINGKGSASNPAKINSAWAVFKDTVIRCRNPFILYLVAMIIFGPVGFLLEYGDFFRRFGMDLYYSVSVPSLSVLGLLTTLGASIVIPMVLFSYFDNRRALDTFHQLPVTRGKMFLGNITAGLFLLFVPFLVTILPVMAAVDIMQACLYTVNRGNAMTWENVWSLFNGRTLQLTVTIVVTALMFYMLMSFLMFCCSTVLESAGYFGIIILGYAGLVTLGMNLIGNATFGYTRDGFWLTDILYRFSPIYYFISSGRSLNIWPYVLQITLLAVVFGLLAWRRAVSRKSEQAGGYIWSPVYYISAIGGSLVVGLVTYSMFRSYGMIFSLFVSIALGMLTYVILDTIRNRGFKNIFRSLMTGVVSVAGVGVFSLLVMVTGTFGYEEWLPNEDKIASVSISDNNFLDGFPLSDTESIHQAVSFHQAVLANQSTLESGNDQPLVEYVPFSFDENEKASAYNETYVTLVYTMKSGRVVAREYNNVPVALTRYLYEIAGSEAYAEAIADQLEAFSQNLPMSGYQIMDDNDIRYEIQLSSLVDEFISTSQSISVNEQTMKEFMAALSEDFRRRPEGWKVNPQEQPVGKVSFYVDNSSYSTYELYIYQSDLNTLDQLEQMGYYDPDTGKISNSVPQNEIFNMEAAVVMPEDYTAAADNGDAGVFHFSDQAIGVVSRSYDDKDDVWDVRDELYAASGEANPHRTAEEQGMLTLNSGEEVPICQRDFTIAEIEELLSQVKVVGYSEEPLSILWINNHSYLIPEENVEAVRELIFK